MSPTYLYAVWRNNFKRYCDAFVRRNSICLFTAFEVMVAKFCVLFYLYHPEVARLVTPTKARHALYGYVGVLSFRVVQGIIGLVACGKRGVGTMKLYFWLLFLSIFYFQLGFLPLLLLRCECSPWKRDYNQCEVVVSFNRGKAKNILPRPPFPFAPLPVSAPTNSSKPRPAAPQVKREHQLPRKVLRLMSSECSCAGEMYVGPQGSCRYIGDGRSSKPSDKAWCYIRQESFLRCLHERKAMQYDWERNLWWSFDLCKMACNSPADCSHVGIENIGSRCQVWDTSNIQDTTEWCFVGYDTNCADRVPYSIDMEFGSELNRPSHFSQYRSSLPCQEAEMARAVTSCMIVRDLLRFLMCFLTLISVPMTAVVFLFVQNRCGDPIEIESQFSVEFSSDESLDDFNVVTFESQRRSPGNSLRGSIAPGAFCNCSGARLDAGHICSRCGRPFPPPGGVGSSTVELVNVQPKR